MSDLPVPAGYLLHSRPYRETSRIASFLTDTRGRIDVLMRPSRSKAQRAFVPVPFCRYELEWAGRSSLPHLQRWEQAGVVHLLQKPALYCGLYVNELVYLLWPQQDEDPMIMSLYANTLSQLSACGADVESALRNFELSFLDVLGYGLSLDIDARGSPLRSDVLYRFEPGTGLVFADHLSGGVVGTAADYEAIARRDFSRTESRHLAKRLMRAVLPHYLGGRPIRSRELFLV